MLQTLSHINVIDNTSAKSLSCIKVNKTGKRPVGSQGDLITASVKELTRVKASITRSQKHLNNKKKRALIRGKVVQAFIVRTKKSLDRSKGIRRKSKLQTGIKVSFIDNAAIIISNKDKPIGSRIKGAVSPLTVNKKVLERKQVFTA